MFCKNKMSQEDRQKFKLKMLHRYEDALEVRMAGIKAAKAKLEEQINLLLPTLLIVLSH